MDKRPGASRSISLALAALLLAAAGCGRDELSAGGSNPPEQQVPITDRALAAVAAEHAGEPYHAQIDNHPYGFEHTIAAAEVSYPVPSDDGDSITVQVGTGLQDEKLATCQAKQPRGGCFEQDGVWVSWYPLIPEEDPGSVSVLAPRDHGVYVSVVFSPSDGGVRGDPRETRLAVPLDDLVAVAKDARLDRTTDQATVDAGESLDYWTFG